MRRSMINSLRLLWFIAGLLLTPLAPSFSPVFVLAGLHDDLASQFDKAIQPRSWDEAHFLAALFVGSLTWDEKIWLTTGTGIMMGPCSGNLASIPRMKFPYLCLQDGPVGLRAVDLVSGFPAGITTGATWDKQLMYLRARAMGVENRIKGVNIVLAPVAGALGRTPAAGRNWEAFGADPYLTGIGNRESVRGIQDEGVIATPKHWIGNEQERYRLVMETFSAIITHSISSEMSERTMKELYEWPFIDAVEAGAAAIMCSYNRVNGEYTCESEKILRQNLKGEKQKGGLGFRGFVMTDWYAEATPQLAAAAGVDMIMPGDAGETGRFAKNITRPDGSTALDDMAKRVIAAYYKLRQDEGILGNISFSSWDPNDQGIWLDRGYIGQINFRIEAKKPLHDEIARRIATDGTVLLKNTRNTLPLRRNIRRIAIFGDDAGEIDHNCGAFVGCANSTLVVGWGSGGGSLEATVAPLPAIQKKAQEVGATVEFELDDWAYDSIRKTARKKDVCLTFINSRSGEGFLDMYGNIGDRNNLTAWRDGDTLVKTVASECRNTVVVVHSVGAIIMEPWIDHPNVTAVIMANLPGTQSGNSLIDVLWGAVNPSGKLPYTIAKNETDYCCKVQYEWNGFMPWQHFSEGLLIDYRWFDTWGIQPRFEFGYGLSYTKFSYDREMHFSWPIPIDWIGFMDTAFTVTTSIRNAGPVEGKEVVQLYLSLPWEAPFGTPVKQLRGFEKVNLKPGHSTQITFPLTKRDLSYWDEGKHAWVTLKGTYTVNIGASSRDIKSIGQITIY